MQANPNLIELQHFSLTSVDGKRSLLQDFNGHLKAGDLVALMGINGCGKSTFLKVLFGQVGFSGQLNIASKPLGQYSQLQLAKLVSVVLTQMPLIESMTVKEVVALGRYPFTGFWGKLDAQDWEQVYSAMELTKISGWGEQFFNRLSDGQKQKVLFARAIAQNTPIMLLDEPTTFLDIPRRKELMANLLTLSRQAKGILFSTHDWELVRDTATLVWLFHEQRIIVGTTHELEAQGVVSKVFQ